MMKVRNRLLNFGDNIIYQDNDCFLFSLDSMLLANFVTIRLSDRKIIDFCSGNAPVPMLLSFRTKARIFGVEIQEYIYKMGLESNVNTINVRFLLGKITDRIEWLNTMDKCILPYIAGYYKENKLDPDFLFRDADGNVINEEVEEMLKPLEEESSLQELEDTLTTVQNIDEMTDKVKEEMERMDKEIEETEDIIDIINGEEVVETVTEEQLEEAEKNTAPSDVMIDADKCVNHEKDIIE